MLPDSPQDSSYSRSSTTMVNNKGDMKGLTHVCMCVHVQQKHPFFSNTQEVGMQEQKLSRGTHNTTTYHAVAGFIGSKRDADKGTNTLRKKNK